MDWLLTTVAVAVVAWIVDKVLDALYAAWRRRRTTPLNDAQVRRYHRWRFALAVAQFSLVLLAFVLLAAMTLRSGAGTVNIASLAALFALLAYLLRVIGRRARRLSLRSVAP